MRICYFHNVVWPEALEALTPWNPEMVSTAGDDFTYWAKIVERWGTDDLVFVEQDIRIHDSVIPEFMSCPEPWCTFPYLLMEPDVFLDKGMCVRFRKEIQELVTPDEIQQIYGSCWACGPDNKPGCWRHIDGKIAQAMENHGFRHHVHYPIVEHLKFGSVNVGLVAPQGRRRGTILREC